MLLALFLLLYPGIIDPPTIYHGRSGTLAVRLPRMEVEPVIDGKLEEQVWSDAAVLTGFSQFSPTDGVPAADSTEVLVWYSPSARTGPWSRPDPVQEPSFPTEAGAELGHQHRAAGAALRA